MSRNGEPVQKTGMHGGRVSFGFDVTVTEVVASVANERSWNQRANAAAMNMRNKVSCGPVFHLSDGAIGCVAAPMSFTYKPSGKYAGLTVGTLSVKHDYFILDVAGDFQGMGVTKWRNEESAVLNRVMLCQHANRLRSRGAHFTEAQVSTIDLHMCAVLRSLPVVDVDDQESSEAGGEDDDEDDEAGMEDSSPHPRQASTSQ